MNRRSSFPSKGLRLSPPCARMQFKDSRQTSSGRDQPPLKQDLNIDEFGDMDSDEDDFQSLSRHFVPPTPPAKPQYNLVPFGLLRDDDELVDGDDDYDGVPIDDTQYSRKKQPWRSSPQKPNEIRGDPITVLGSSVRHVVSSQKRNKASRNLQGSSLSDVNVIEFSGNDNQRRAFMWDHNTHSASNMGSGNVTGNPVVSRGKTTGVRSQDTTNRFLKSGNIQSSSSNFIQANEHSNPLMKMGNEQTMEMSGNVSSFDSAKIDPKRFLQPAENTQPWNANAITSQSSTPLQNEHGRGFENFKGQALPDLSQTYTSANAPSQIDLLQAAALQQALAGLSQLSSQSGLNLLMQASQNPTLAAALVSTGLGSIQPNALANPVEALLKSAVTAALPVSSPSLGTLINPPQSKIVGHQSSKSLKVPIPDGSGATRYPAPDVASLVFDPSTGYRFDASTGLHYDANSGYFFNNELKLFLRWDKFTQTYLRVDNPPGVPRFNNSSAERMSYIKPLVGSPNIGLPSSSYSDLVGLSTKNARSVEGFPKQSNHGPNLPSPSFHNERSTVPHGMNIPPDFSKPPPPLPHNPASDSRTQPVETASSRAADAKAAALPNFAETSLFNKLRKAKLAQNAQSKLDRKRWGSPDPLIEAAQKHVAEVNQPKEDVLNLKEILLRSRQFMKQKAEPPLNLQDEHVLEHTRKNKSRSESGGRRRIRSRSRSPGRAFRRAQSPERPGIGRGRSSMSPQIRKSPVRSPDSKRQGRPGSRGRSPDNRGRRKQSLSLEKRRNTSTSPMRRKMLNRESKSPIGKVRGKPSLSPETRRRISASSNRSPTNRLRCKASPSEARKRRLVSRESSPSKRRGKASKSPSPKLRRPTSRGRSPTRRPGRMVISSPDVGKGIPPSHTLDHSHSPNSHPGRSKVCAPSLGRNSKRSRDQGHSPDRKRMRHKSRSDNNKKTEKIQAPSTNSSTKESAGVKTGTESPHGHRKSTSLEKRRETSSYKSLSNVRNQGKVNVIPKDPEKKSTLKNEPSGSAPKIDLTKDSDDDKRSRANQRLVSERTFSSGWERTSSDLLVTIETTNFKTEVSVPTLDIDKKNEQTPPNLAEGETLQEHDEYDFLNDTLDDDKDSTIIDEYEEILDYQDLEGTSEVLKKESTDVDNSDKFPLSKSPVIELSIEPNEPAVEASGPECVSNEVVTAQDEEDAPASGPDRGGSETCSSEGLMVDEKLEESIKESHTSPEETNKSGNLVEETSKDSTAKIEPDHEDLKVVDEASIENRGASEDKAEPMMDQHDPGETGPKVLENKEWNVLDSVDDQEETKLVETNDPEVKLVVDSHKFVDDRNEVISGHAVEVEIEEQTKDNKVSVKVDSKDSKKEGISYEKRGGIDDEPHVQEKVDDGKRKFIISESDREEPPAHVRSGNRGTSEDKAEPMTDQHDPVEIGPEVLENEEWNVLDSVDDQEETKLVETNDPEVKLVVDSHKFVDDRNEVISGHAVEVETEEQTKDNEVSVKVDSKDSKKEGISYEKRGGIDDEPHVQEKVDDGKRKVIISETGREEPPAHVRSVSDIEKFLLLSSQEVEAMREQGIEPSSSKSEKKADIFSRLGEKLQTNEVGSEPTLVVELPVETSGPSQSPLKIASPSKVVKTVKPVTTNNATKRNKPNEDDPVRKLFNDENPTSTVLIGPMNFIEPLKSFQHFTQKYMVRLLQEEKVSYKNVYVCHEDVTGAPYHYILVMFQSVQGATNWYKKRKGKFKFDQKLFKRVSGHTKQKCVPGAETFMHFSGNNWICKVCKKGNFPCRSLCFGCFQHKDPEGFSPVTLLDLGVSSWKPSRFVGTPRLKFFVTQEKILESAPPLDGFDIKRIEMIMDEKMGFPAGICVFEMYNVIEAGKLKKYLNRREVEAVSVEMHDNPNAESSSSKEAPRESVDELGLVSEGDGRVVRKERVPRSSSREIRITRVRSPSSSRIRVQRRSPSPPREVRVARVRSPSLPRSRLSRERARSRSPGHYSPGRRSPRHQYEGSRHSPSGRSVSRGAFRAASPSREPYLSPRYLSPPRYRLPLYDSPRRSRSPRFRSPSPSRPIKPDGLGHWSYPPPDPTNFKFESRSGLDYDPTTTLYYEPKSCCFYNDDTNVWLEYDPRTGRYILVR